MVTLERGGRTVCFFRQMVIDTHAGFAVCQYTRNLVQSRQRCLRVSQRHRIGTPFFRQSGQGVPVEVADNLVGIFISFYFNLQDTISHVPRAADFLTEILGAYGTFRFQLQRSVKWHFVFTVAVYQIFVYPIGIRTRIFKCIVLQLPADCVQLFYSDQFGAFVLRIEHRFHRLGIGFGGKCAQVIQEGTSGNKEVHSLLVEHLWIYLQ